ncbi:hypothetical protein LOC73_17970 [Mycolicibacterium mageritense]|nr:hypothetical protein [Mycolicibacterium mageritense]
MAESCISAGLADLGLVDWPVATGIPDPRPDRFVQCVVTGGRKRNRRLANHLVTARVHRPKAEAVECGEVARCLAGVLEAAAETVSAVTKASVESCERFDDPDLTEVAVYQVVVAWIIAIPV